MRKETVRQLVSLLLVFIVVFATPAGTIYADEADTEIGTVSSYGTSNYSKVVTVGSTLSMTLYFTSNVSISLTSEDSTIATASVTGTSLTFTSSDISYGKTITIYGIRTGETVINVTYGSTILAAISVSVIPSEVSFSCYFGNSYELTVISYVSQSYYVDSEEVNVDYVSTTSKTTTSSVTINGSTVSQTITTYTSVITVSFNDIGNIIFSLYGSESGEIISVNATINNKLFTTIIASDIDVGINNTTTIDAFVSSSGALTYVSNDESIATVNDEGIVTGVSEGTTTITVSAAETEDSCAASIEINVIVKKTATITIATELEVEVGSTITINASASSGGTLSFESSDTSVADVSSSGVITGISEGTAVILVTAAGTDEYASVSSQVNVTVTKALIDISDTMITLSDYSYVYTGTAKRPSVTVTYNGEELVKGVDYSVSYSDNINAGTATVTITGGGDYKGTVTETFTITKKERTVEVYLTSSSIKYGETATVIGSFNGDGQASYASSDTSVATVNSAGEVSAVGVGSTIITVTVPETDTYKSGSATVSITVTLASQALSVTSSSVSLAAGETSALTISGAKTPLSYSSSNMSVATVDSNGKITAKAVGTATITVTAAAGNNYSKATKSIEVTVKPAATTVSSVTNTTSGVKITWKKVTGATGYYIYRSTSQNGTYTKIATVKSGSTVTYTNKTSGTYKVSSGKTYYYKVSAYASTGTASKSGAKSVKYLTAGKISSLTNTSSGITLKWSKVTGASGYYVYRKTGSSSYSKIKTVTGGSTTSYTDMAVKSKNGTTYTYKVVPYSGSNTGSFTARKTVRMTDVSISSVKNSSSKKMTVKWSKNSKATGYQIQYSTSSSFASGNKTVTVSKVSTTSSTISKLTKGKKYYVRIRAYKTVSGTKYCSAWSSKKSVKISK